MSWHPVGPIVLSLVITALIIGTPVLVVRMSEREVEARRRRAALLDRLHWVMATSRNGGYWTEAGYRRKRVRPYGKGGPVHVVEYFGMRWVWA